MIDPLAKVAYGILNQTIADGAKKGADSVSRLVSLIELTALEEQRQAETVGQSGEFSQKLSKMVDFVETKIEGLHTMKNQVKKSEQEINSLRKYSEKIQSITGLLHLI